MPNTSKIAVVGTGNIGSVIARLVAAAGHEVYISNSRGPDTLTPFAAELGPGAHASTVEDAVDASDIVVVSIPFGRYSDLPAAHFDGRIVIDATNYIPFRDTNVAAEIAGTSNPAQLLQKHLSGARVVKTFSSIYSGHLLDLARPHGADDRSALPLAGDDADAKAHVTAFMNGIGWDAVDTGNLDTSVRFQVGTPVFVKAYMADDSGTGDEWGARMVTDPGKPVSASSIRKLIDTGVVGT